MALINFKSPSGTFKAVVLSLTTCAPIFLGGLCFAQAAPHSLPVLTGAHEKITRLYEQQSGVKAIGQVALSPDGSQVAWSVADGISNTHRLYVAKTTGLLKALPVFTGSSRHSCDQDAPRWAPDGHHLASLSDCEKRGQMQLFVADTAAPARQTRQITHVSGFISKPQWSPDSQRIALLYVDKATRAPTPMAPEDKAVGVIDDLESKDVQRLAICDLATGITRQVTPAGLYVFEYDWSPDGRTFAYTASAPPGDDNWYIAQLYTQSMALPEPRVIYKPSLQIALPRWSPDGKSIAFIEGLMSDEGATGGEIFRISFEGGEPQNLTPGRSSSPSWFTWLSDRELIFTEFVGGSTAVESLTLADLEAKRLWFGGETIEAGAEATSLSVAMLSQGMQVALTRMSWALLPEVWVGSLDNLRQLTRINADVKLALPRSKSISWISGGLPVQGWLLFPSSYDPAKTYPMLVSVHGGPAWITTPVWKSEDFNVTLFTNLGYFVFFPNDRGSFGQGEKFTQANRRDWGFGDLQDMLAGVDEAVRQYPIHPDRIGVIGWSYGGSTAMISAARTNRFRAAVAGAGASNLQSYYGQNSIDKWMFPYFGASVYDDTAAYMRSSAISYVKQARTPTLLLVGERDGEAPPAQSFEFWHALKELNVPTQLVIYADEGHSFFREKDRVDLTWRALSWFEQYMGVR